MSLLAMLRTVAVAAALSTVLASAALADDDDDEDCDSIMNELKQLTERVITANDPKEVGPVCAATGQLLGIMKASREVASECYDEGEKRDRLVENFEKAAKEMEAKMNSVCK
jgi:cytochrome c556